MAKRIAKGAGAGLLLAAALVVALISSAGAAPAAKPAAGKPAADCQPFTRTPCLLPFPNNMFTRRDRSSATGLRVALPGAAMPVNAKGQRISTAEYNRNDGFSPGSTVIAHVPGLDNVAAFTRTAATATFTLRLPRRAMSASDTIPANWRSRSTRR